MRESIANAPEKSDEQMAKLLVQLEELESQFADPKTNAGDQFLTDIISKREEIYETFEAISSNCSMRVTTKPKT